MTRSITIEAQPREQIDVNLVGKHYLIDPPKAATTMQLAEQASENKGDTDAMLGLLKDWIAQTFGPKHSPKVLARLYDQDDLLDLGHIMSLMTQIAEAQTGNPPTSPPAS
jgi:hypothetical protein